MGRRQVCMSACITTAINMLQGWKAWFDEDAPEEAPIPDGYASTLDTFRKLLLIRCWCPDRSIPMARTYVAEAMGDRVRWLIITVSLCFNVCNNVEIITTIWRVKNVPLSARQGTYLVCIHPSWWMLKLLFYPLQQWRYLNKFCLYVWLWPCIRFHFEKFLTFLNSIDSTNSIMW